MLTKISHMFNVILKCLIRERKMTLILPKEWFMVSLHIKCTQQMEWSLWVALVIEATTNTNKVYIAFTCQLHVTIAMISFTNILEQGSHVSLYWTQTLCVDIIMFHNYNQNRLFGYHRDIFGRIICHERFRIKLQSWQKKLWSTIHKPYHT